MPKETSLNDPLSGAEIKQMILDDVSISLDKNTVLTDDIAYAGFSHTFECKVKLLRSPTPQTLAWGSGGAGEVEGGEETTVTAEAANESPNAARIAHELPVPVLTQGPNGPTRRKVKAPHVKAKK